MRPIYVTLLVAAPLLQAQSPMDPAGHWEGTIEMPRQAVPAAVDLAKGADGRWIGTLSILGSAVLDVPLAQITLDAAKLSFRVALPDNPLFDGTLSADAEAIAGTASNSMGAVPFSLKRKGTATVKLPPPSSPLTKDFEGAWEGMLEAGGKQLRLSLTLTSATDGTAAGRLQSLDEGNPSIPITTATIEGKELRIEARGVSGSYKGTLGANGEIAGEWAQGAGRFPLVLKRPASR